MANFCELLLTKEKQVERAKEYVDRGGSYFMDTDYGKAAEYFNKACILYTDVYGHNANELAILKIFHSSSLNNEFYSRHQKPWSRIDAIEKDEIHRIEIEAISKEATEIISRQSRAEYFTRAFLSFVGVAMESGHCMEALEFYEKFLTERPKMQSLLPSIGDIYMKIGSMCQVVGLFNLSYATLETAYTYYKLAISEIEKKPPADGLASDNLIRIQDLEDKQRQIINVVIENERLQSRPDTVFRKAVYSLEKDLPKLQRCIVLNPAYKSESPPSWTDYICC